MSKIQHTATALKQMRKLAPEIRERLRSKISEYAETGKGDVTAMQGVPIFRLRVGDYHLVFSDGPTSISILRAGHRREIYR